MQNYKEVEVFAIEDVSEESVSELNGETMDINECVSISDSNSICSNSSFDEINRTSQLTIEPILTSVLSKINALESDVRNTISEHQTTKTALKRIKTRVDRNESNFKRRNQKFNKCLLIFILVIISIPFFVFKFDQSCDTYLTRFQRFENEMQSYEYELNVTKTELNKTRQWLKIVGNRVDITSENLNNFIKRITESTPVDTNARFSIETESINTYNKYFINSFIIIAITALVILVCHVFTSVKTNLDLNKKALIETKKEMERIKFDFTFQFAINDEEKKFIYDKISSIETEFKASKIQPENNNSAEFFLSLGVFEKNLVDADLEIKKHAQLLDKTTQELVEIKTDLQNTKMEFSNDWAIIEEENCGLNNKISDLEQSLAPILEKLRSVERELDRNDSQRKENRVLPGTVAYLPKTAAPIWWLKANGRTMDEIYSQTAINRENGYIKIRLDKMDSSSVPTGTVAYFLCGCSPPFDWIKARGQTVSRNLYANLYLNIGTTFGCGDGINTFTLPDYPLDCIFDDNITKLIPLWACIKC